MGAAAASRTLVMEPNRPGYSAGRLPAAPAARDDGAKYEILRVVNRGGMGEIALGRVKGAKGFEKLVVLKRLRADAEREDHRQMFDVEAELMSRIEHPNIVQVFDQPTVDGVQYLAMAYVQGRNLDQVIRKTRGDGHPMSAEFALTVTCEMLRGLAFVHRLKDAQGRALGVVHQDITPSNVMVSFFGEVKITDFGIAYVTSRDGGKRKGVLKGKPRYVAPEVLAGKRVNNRADIYGTAVVLYELLTGKPLFARNSLDETLTAVAKSELPEFSETLPMVSAGVHRIMTQALAKDPNDRYRSAEDMHRELAQELGRAGGSLSSSQLGYLMRRWFAGAPDVPEVDPTLDETQQVMRAPNVAANAPDLQQTLSELDRLLGGETGSADVFDLPPELQRELEEIEDGDPFAALTPIPELALSGPNGEELLMKAMLKEPTPLGDGQLPSFPSSDRPISASRPAGEQTGESLAAARNARMMRATGEYTFTAPVLRKRPEAGAESGRSQSDPWGHSEALSPSSGFGDSGDLRAGRTPQPESRTPRPEHRTPAPEPASSRAEARTPRPEGWTTGPESRTPSDDQPALDRGAVARAASRSATVRDRPAALGFVPGLVLGLVLGACLGVLVGWKLLAG